MVAPATPSLRTRACCGRTVLDQREIGACKRIVVLEAPEARAVGEHSDLDGLRRAAHVARRARRDEAQDGGAEYDRAEAMHLHDGFPITQTPPAPTAMSAGVTPTGMVVTRLVRASIRDTVSSREFATQTAP